MHLTIPTLAEHARTNPSGFYLVVDSDIDGAAPLHDLIKHIPRDEVAQVCFSGHSGRILLKNGSEIEGVFATRPGYLSRHGVTAFAGPMNQQVARYLRRISARQ